MRTIPFGPIRVGEKKVKKKEKKERISMAYLIFVKYEQYPMCDYSGWGIMLVGAARY